MLRIIGVGVILAIALSNLLSPLYARKLVHVGCGLILASINLPEWSVRSLIIAVALGTIVVTATFPMRFGVKNDAGIIWYNIVVLHCVLQHIPLRLLIPAFVVDPLAWIAGTSIRSRQWCGTKTVAGTLAAAIGAYFSLYYVKTRVVKLLLTVVIALIEGLMGKHDNLGISLVVLAYYYLAQHSGLYLDI